MFQTQHSWSFPFIVAGVLIGGLLGAAIQSQTTPAPPVQSPLLVVLIAPLTGGRGSQTADGLNVALSKITGLPFDIDVLAVDNSNSRDKTGEVFDRVIHLSEQHPLIFCGAGSTECTLELRDRLYQINKTRVEDKIPLLTSTATVVSYETPEGRKPVINPQVYPFFLRNTVNDQRRLRMLFTEMLVDAKPPLITPDSSIILLYQARTQFSQDEVKRSEYGNGLKDMAVNILDELKHSPHLKTLGPTFEVPFTKDSADIREEILKGLNTDEERWQRNDHRLVFLLSVESVMEQVASIIKESTLADAIICVPDYIHSCHVLDTTSSMDGVYTPLPVVRSVGRWKEEVAKVLSRMQNNPDPGIGDGYDTGMLIRAIIEKANPQNTMGGAREVQKEIWRVISEENIQYESPLWKAKIMLDRKSNECGDFPFELGRISTRERRIVSAANFAPVTKEAPSVARINRWPYGTEAMSLVAIGPAAVIGNLLRVRTTRRRAPAVTRYRKEALLWLLGVGALTSVGLVGWNLAIDRIGFLGLGGAELPHLWIIVPALLGALFGFAINGMRDLVWLLRVAIILVPSAGLRGEAKEILNKWLERLSENDN